MRIFIIVFDNSIKMLRGIQWAYGRIYGRILLLLFLAVLCLVANSKAQEWTDATSREVTLYAAADPRSDVYSDAISREVSVNLTTTPNPDEFTDAVSREISINLSSIPDVNEFPDAVSREITIRNDMEFADAVSREISVRNDVDLIDAITREISVLTTPLAKAKLRQDGDRIVLQGENCVIVTAVFDDCIYIEASDRSAGIKVTGKTAKEGAVVNVSGFIRTADTGERYIEADKLLENGQSVLQPLGVILKSLYCGGYEFDPQGKLGQTGVTDGNGTNLVGMLVRLAAKVVPGSSGDLMVDDGTGKPVKVILPAAVEPPSLDDFVEINGILVLEKTGDAKIPVVKATKLTEVTGNP